MRTLRSSLFFSSPGAKIRLFAALASASIAGLAAPAASAGPRGGLRVNVASPDGKGCISSEKLKSEVLLHTKGTPKPAAVDVEIEAVGPGWVADVAVAGRAGKRTVKTQSGACSKLDEGLVLVVTLLVDPDEEEPAPAPAGHADKDSPDEDEPAPAGGSSWGKDDPEEEPGDEAPAAGKKPGAPTGDSPNAPEPEAGPWGKGKKGGDKGSPDKAPPNNAPADKGSPAKGGQEPGKKGGKEKGDGDLDRRHRFGISASAVYTAGLLPVAAPGVRVAFSWMPPVRFMMEGAFTYFAPVDEYRSTGSYSGQRHVETFQAELDACPAKLDTRWVHFAACAGLSLTRYQHYLSDMSGYSGNDPLPYYGYGTTEDWMLSSLADLRLDVSLFSAMRIGAGLGVQVPAMNRPGQNNGFYPVEGFDSFADGVIFQARAGITLVLPP